MKLEPHEFEKHDLGIDDELKVSSFTFSIMTVTRKILLDVLKAPDNEERLKIIHNLWAEFLSIRNNIMDDVFMFLSRVLSDVYSGKIEVEEGLNFINDLETTLSSNLGITEFSNKLKVLELLTQGFYVNLEDEKGGEK